MLNHLTSRMSVCIAVGERTVLGVLRTRDASLSESVPLQVAATPEEAGSRVAAAIAQLRDRLDAAAGRSTAGARADIVLLPPHAEVRLLTLPPLNAADAAAVVQRDAGRHFLSVPAPRVTAAHVAARKAAAPVLAAAAAAALVEAVRAAAASAGWRAGTVSAAHASWIAAAGADVDALVAVDGDTAHVLRLARGTPHTLRRLPFDALDECVAAAGEGAPDGSGVVAILAEPSARESLRQHFAAAGWQPAAARADALDAAARHAGSGALALVPASEHLARRNAERRTALRLAAATVLLTVGAAAAELWGAHRELSALRDQRAAIRADVQPLLALRDSVDQLHSQLGEVAVIAGEAPRWTPALYDIALLLPPETHLTRLHTSGDTVTMEAQGARGGAALQALRSARSLRDARLVGMIDRELADGATAVERFRITARLARAAPIAPPDPDGTRAPATHGPSAASGASGSTQ